MWKLYIECYTKKYFDFKGRASRKEYISFMLFNIIVLCLPFLLILISKSTLDEKFTNQFILYFVLIYVVVSLIPALSLWARRLHDFNFRVNRYGQPIK